MKRTEFVVSVTALSLAGMLPAQAQAVDMVTFHCGSGDDCCSHWVAQARLHGYKVAMFTVADALRMEKCRIPKSLASCHTAIVGNYFFEGHIPFNVIDRFLAEQPASRGIAIVGTPLGLPGMEGRWPEPIDVVFLDDPKKVYVTLPPTA
jgi:hypothetical protein